MTRQQCYWRNLGWLDAPVDGGVSGPIGERLARQARAWRQQPPAAKKS